MSSGLTLLSDDELDRLREKVAEFARLANSEQKIAASCQLESIDIERDRRLVAQPTPRE